MTATTTRGRPSGWLLPDDGHVDQVAVELTVSGVRRVPLTRTERREVAARIAAAGGTAYDVARRLHVSYATAQSLLGGTA